MVVTPVWTEAPWWPLLSRLKISSYTPVKRSVFEDRYGKPLPGPKWMTNVVATFYDLEPLINHLSSVDVDSSMDEENLRNYSLMMLRVDTLARKNLRPGQHAA